MKEIKKDNKKSDLMLKKQTDYLQIIKKHQMKNAELIQKQKKCIELNKEE